MWLFWLPDLPVTLVWSLASSRCQSHRAKTLAISCTSCYRNLSPSLVNNHHHHHHNVNNNNNNNNNNKWDLSAPFLKRSLDAYIKNYYTQVTKQQPQNTQYEHTVIVIWISISMNIYMKLLWAWCKNKLWKYPDTKQDEARERRWLTYVLVPVFSVFRFEREALGCHLFSMSVR